MIKFTKLDNPTTKKNKKAKPEEWYIYKFKLFQSAAFYKTAGGVGGKKLAEAELLVLEIKKGKTASAKLIEYKYKEDPHVRE